MAYTFWSQSWQDEFVANLLNFKRNGYYLDIGSGPPDAQSNSYFFDKELGWKGVCVELSAYEEAYKKLRTCKFINGDATKVDYKKVLGELEFPKRMDLLSVDTDENSALSLKALPLDEYRFNICIVEHDFYRLKNSIKYEEREIFKKYGYHLLFQDVFVPLGCGSGSRLPYEDWYVDLDQFNVDKLSKLVVKLKNDDLYPDHIVATLKTMPDVIKYAYLNK